MFSHPCYYVVQDERRVVNVCCIAYRYVFVCVTLSVSPLQGQGIWATCVFVKVQRAKLSMNEGFDEDKIPWWGARDKKPGDILFLCDLCGSQFISPETSPVTQVACP